MADRRLLENWLAAYLEYNKQHESPETLHLWTALTVIAASIRRKVYIELEEPQGRVYPNLFVIIVAESARVRKSTAMDFGRDLLIEAFPDMRIMRDSMTSQGLMREMNKATKVLKDNKIVEEQQSSVAIFADEIANLFSYDKMRAAQMTIFLTRTYGCPAVYDHTTARDSLMRLYNLYPVFLGGTDPRNLKTIPEEASGGLTGRLIWVVESERRNSNSGWKRDEMRVLRQRLLREALIEDLIRIGNLSGEILVKPEAQDYYDEWYHSLSKRDTRDPDVDAFQQRCHTTALRIAELLSIANSDDLVITLDQMRSAIHLIEQQLLIMKRVLVWSGTTQYTQQRAKLISFLQKGRGVCKRSTLLNHMGMQVDEFDRMIATLVQDGTIDIPPLQTVKGETIIKLVVSA